MPRLRPHLALLAGLAVVSMTSASEAARRPCPPGMAADPATGLCWPKRTPPANTDQRPEPQPPKPPKKTERQLPPGGMTLMDTRPPRMPGARRR